MLKFQQIEAFRVVMLRGTMTSAAEDLHTSQPSISRLIADLEKELQLKLFIRHAGRLQATAAAASFYQEVLRSYTGLDLLEKSAQQIRMFGTGRLRVTGTPAIVQSVLPDVIKEYQNHYPRVLISLDMRSESTVRKWTSSSFCDIGFATASVNTRGICCETLYRLPALCVLPKNHHLSSNNYIRLTDFQNEKIILPTDNDTTKTGLENALKNSKIIPNPVIETPYGALTGLLCEKNIGIGLINPLVARSLLNHDIIFKRLDANIWFDGYVLYPHSHIYNTIVQDFIKITKEKIADMSDEMGKKISK